MPRPASRPTYSNPIRSRLVPASPAPPSAPAPMEFDKPEVKPAGPVVKNYNPRPSAFTRFFERGLNQSGNRSDDRRGNFKFREGPFKGLTLGQAEERAFDLYNNLDPSVKAKYQRMADSKRGFDPRGTSSMGSSQIYTGRYLGDGSLNPNRRTDDYRVPPKDQGVLYPPKPESNSTEPDFDNAPRNNNLAQNQQVNTEPAPSPSPSPAAAEPAPSGAPTPSASKPSGGLIVNDENPSSAVSSPTMTPAPKNPFTTEQGDKKPAPSDRGTINGMPTAQALNESDEKPEPSDRGYIDGMPTAQALSESESRVDAMRGSAGTKEESSKPAAAESSKAEKTYDLDPELVELGKRLSSKRSDIKSVEELRAERRQMENDVAAYNQHFNRHIPEMVGEVGDPSKGRVGEGEEITHEAYADYRNKRYDNIVKSQLAGVQNYEVEDIKDGLPWGAWGHRIGLHKEARATPPTQVVAAEPKATRSGRNIFGAIESDEALRTSRKPTRPTPFVSR